ncbi:MAG: 16S rRNA (cytidine(1402)-2'-O)-methyltransferase [Pseudomonadota bacterium]
MQTATLYVVATPIGNLADLSPRAEEVLGGVATIACEDTRHTRRLLEHVGLRTPTVALHEHNERERVDGLVERLVGGEDLALVSDAGTPLVSDPGYRLVRAAHAAGVRVVSVPGPSAVIAALAGAGLPSDRFCFEGFLPSRAAARRQRIEELADEPRTLVLFEAPHRIVASLQDLCELLGPERPGFLARELSKRFETFLGEDLGTVLERVEGDSDQQRGEMVLVLGGAPEPGADELPREARRAVELLATELPPRKAADLAARLTGARKNALYRHLQDRDD